MMKISQKGIDEIIQREALRLTAYRCEAGRLTIGIGHTAGVYEGMMISKETAFRLFREDIAPVERHLNALNEQLIRKFKQYEYDALISFIHQIGLTNFRNSTCRRYILAERPAEQIAAEFVKWCYVTKKVKDDQGNSKFVKVWSYGVENRHSSEREQFLGKHYVD